MSETPDGPGGSRPSAVPFDSQFSKVLRAALRDSIEESQWANALERRDCKKLMLLLHQNPLLKLVTGRDGRTVLHVAVIQGCVQLVTQIFEPEIVNQSRDRNNQLGKFERSNKDGRKPSRSSTKKLGAEDLKKLLKARDARSKADAFNLAEIVGNKEVLQILGSKPSMFKGGPVRHQNFERLPADVSDSESSEVSDDSENGSVDGASILDYDLQPINFDRDEAIKIIDEVLASGLYTKLQQNFEWDVDFNFEEDRKELIIHCACKSATFEFIDFIRIIIEMMNERPGLLQKVFNVQDAQGRTPVHLAITFCWSTQGLKEFLDLLPEECVNGLDAAGRTPLHRAVANGMNFVQSKIVQVLANDRRTNLNAEWPGGEGATALHMAVLHNHAQSARYLLEAKRVDGLKRANLEQRMDRPIKVYKNKAYSHWTPLELAAVMGRTTVLEQLLRASVKTGRKWIRDQRCLHLAAASGDPQSVLFILNSRRGNLHHFKGASEFDGHSPLHFAVYAKLPHHPTSKNVPTKLIDPNFDRFLCFPDYASVYWLQREFAILDREGASKKKGTTAIGYDGKKACINILLQAGFDIWYTQEIYKPTYKRKAHIEEYLLQEEPQVKPNISYQNIPDPGREASDEARLWWYERVAKETLEAKNSFNAAGNATAVVAALVATASFVGPLQPPLGYGTDTSTVLTLDRIQVTKLSIRIFFISNSLSFYLALASIMLAIMPSLPMPHEGLRDELHRSRRTVALAISVLLLSILSILVSFTCSSITGIPDDYSWGLKFYPVFIGGLACIIVIFLFFLRLLRLVFSTNGRIKGLYQLFGKL